jgi:hypothetical protein
MKYCSFGNPLDALVVCSRGLDYFRFWNKHARTAMWPPLPYTNVIFSWQSTRKCGNSTGDLYRSVSTWNIWVPYQSETGSRCWMQQTFALWQTKRQSQIHLVFCCLMTPRQSIEWWLFACPVAADPRPATPQFTARTSYCVSFCHWNMAVFNSTCATRRMEKLLTIERIYIGFISCYFTLLYFIYDVSFFLSSTQLL